MEERKTGVLLQVHRRPVGITIAPVREIEMRMEIVKGYKYE